MLKTLSVSNYALIDELSLLFGNGLNIITGETGAGKSVLLGAIGLLLGDRADSGSLLDKSKKCIIKGEFHVSPHVKSFLERSDLDAEELILHREIGKDGKSRSFVNDTPVNLSLLRELGTLLVDIHSQHETLLLNKSDFQMSVVDAFAGNNKLLNSFVVEYKNYKDAFLILNSLKEEEIKLRNDQDFLRFQFDELNDADLIPGEQAKLEEEITALTHAEEIKQGISRFSEVLSGSENNLLSELSASASQIAGLGKYLDSLNAASARLKAVEIELKDIDYEIQQAADKIVFDPRRIEVVNERLDKIYRLQKKHRTNSIEDLIQIRITIESKLNSFSTLEEEISNKEKEADYCFRKATELAGELSEKRKKAIPTFETKIKKMLSDLAMPEANFKVELSKDHDGTLNQYGHNKIRFLFSANKGIPVAEISKVASGGELSRLMLCLKAGVAKLVELPSIIFDEIDTGVSGETAFKIGKVLYELSSSHQLIAITHLPQIASRGEDHFFVYKEFDGKKTLTKVKKLLKDDRVVEIARMFSGDKPTATAIKNAKELLENS